MNVLGIYGSPRKGGNSDLLLDRVLEGAQESGAGVRSLYVRDVQPAGCRECGGCASTGQCVVRDSMDAVYADLAWAGAVVVATPVFFYGPPSGLKALMDRAQAAWSGRMLKKKGDARNTYESGHGYLVAVGATRGKNLFQGLELTAKYFFDALDMDYRGGLFFRQVDARGAIAQVPGALDEALALGRQIAG